MAFAGRVAHVGEIRKISRIFIGKPEGMDLKEIQREGVNWN
jgi:hypothetical protein